MYSTAQKRGGMMIAGRGDGRSETQRPLAITYRGGRGENQGGRTEKQKQKQLLRVVV